MHAPERRNSNLNPLSDEVASAAFGDRRLTKRLGQLIDAVARAPEESFPRLSRSEAELEGTYRFLNNDRVTPERILAPHQQATCARIAKAGTVLIIHDTTQFLFGGEERTELGWLRSKSLGFLGHFALAVTSDEHHCPLGVLGFSTVSREREAHGKHWKERYIDPANEFLRWGALIETVEGQLTPGTAIHVMDREADSFELLAQLVDRKGRFVIRMQHDRLVSADGDICARTLHGTLPLFDDVLEREVPISRRGTKGRPPSDRKVHPPRNCRVAKLRFGARAVTIKCPDDLGRVPLPPFLRLNVVHVHEIDPPADEEPVEWILVTTEPIETSDQVATIVDHYRGRWVIEELFKALKTGCAFERRQLVSKAALLNTLAVLVQVAWRLLFLRTLARVTPNRPATDVLTPVQLHLLRLQSIRVKLSERPTVWEAMLAVAGLGGHLRRNGMPGWQTLGSGLEKLLVLEAGWIARDRSGPLDGCDQS